MWMSWETQVFVKFFEKVFGTNVSLKASKSGKRREMMNGMLCYLWRG